MRVGVIGAGSWGSALASALAANGINVSIWGRNTKDLQSIQDSATNDSYLPGIKLAKGIRAATDLDDLLSSSHCLLVCVPSHGFADTIRLVKQKGVHLPIIWASKGLVPVTGNFFHDEIEAVFGKELPYAFLGGPSFAKEVANNLPTAVLIAGNDDDFNNQARDLFHSDVFRVYLSSDVIGAQIGGIVKNIIAVATGISDGIGFGANSRAALITRGIAEMLRFGEALGGAKYTLMGLSGCGDMILTCTDNQSRNRRLGLALAKGLSIEAAQEEVGQVVEAVFNAQEVCNKANQYQLDMPISSHVNSIFQGKMSVREAFASLVARQTTAE